MSVRKEVIERMIARYGGDILRSEGMQREKGFTQHGSISVYAHSKRVAQMSLRIAIALGRAGVRIDRRSLVRGALLHDYFLYDWHERKCSIRRPLKMHGFTHAGEALRNAERDFALTRRERDIIEKHMFPLNIRPPRFRESLIVSCADKICAVTETVRRR